MHKRLSKNLFWAIEKAKSRTKQDDLKKIPCQKIVKAIAKRKGSFGKVLMDSFGLNESKQQLSLSGQDLLLRAINLAHQSESSYVGTEHVVSCFFNISKQPSNQERSAKRKKFEDFDLPSDDSTFDSQDFFNEINSLVGNFFPAKMPGSNRKNSALNDYCSNLCLISQDDVLIGRNKELARISHLLGRKMKNNPVLVGDPGVGKTAIVEGLARNIEKGTAPYYLSGKKILSLDLGLLIAGTTFRGEFEARLKEIVSEVKKDPDLILFIDEIHNLVGAGNAVGGMDAANLLKPALSRGEIQVIGATTHDEYHKHIEKDAALERRFQPIIISEPSVDETEKILHGIKPHYEKYHNVSIHPEANRAASLLAKRYLTDRHLPDSAIDLIDETSARLRSQLTDSRLYYELKKIQQQYDSIIEHKEKMVINDQYEGAIKARDKEKVLQKKLSEAKKQVETFEKQNPVKVEEKDIRETLSQTTNIPTELLSQKDQVIAKNVRMIYRKNLIGQNHVVKNITDTVIRQISGISIPDRPLGSFLFIGPTGVGKTYAAKLLAESISPQGEPSLIQINMSEFGEKHTVSRLLGAPAGYIGYEESGELTEKVRKRPYSVVLFDEVEKADSSVLNVLLQILEEGELVDSKSRKINFRNTVVILTSNIGTHELNQASRLGFESGNRKAQALKKEAGQKIEEQIQETLAPELVNRLDNLLIFNSLSERNISRIVSSQIKDLQKRVRTKNITLKISPGVEKYLAKQSVDPAQGARLVRKHIQDHIEPVIANEIIKKKKVDSIKVGLRKDKVVVL